MKIYVFVFVNRKTLAEVCYYCDGHGESNLGSAAEHCRPRVNTAQVFLKLCYQLFLVLYRRKRFVILLLQLVVTT